MHNLPRLNSVLIKSFHMNYNAYLLDNLSGKKDIYENIQEKQSPYFKRKSHDHLGYFKKATAGLYMPVYIYQKAFCILSILHKPSISITLASLQKHNCVDETPL